MLIRAISILSICIAREPSDTIVELAVRETSGVTHTVTEASELTIHSVLGGQLSPKAKLSPPVQLERCLLSFGKLVQFSLRATRCLSDQTISLSQSEPKFSSLFGPQVFGGRIL